MSLKQIKTITTFNQKGDVDSFGRRGETKRMINQSVPPILNHIQPLAGLAAILAPAAQAGPGGLPGPGRRGLGAALRGQIEEWKRFAHASEAPWTFT